MISAAIYKGKINLVNPLHYKLEEGLVQAFAWPNELIVTLYSVPNADRIGLINQYFGENGTTFYQQLGLKGHDGIDLYGKIGNCIYASCDGVITALNDPVPENTTYNPATWGFVQQDCEQNGIKFRLKYGHVSDVLVKVGDQVKANQLLALLGNTGKYTTGPHCHVQFQLITASGQVLNLDNGYLGAIDHLMLYDDLTVYKSDGLKKLYEYAKANGISYFGDGGAARFEAAKIKLSTVTATISDYYDYLLRNKLSD